MKSQPPIKPKEEEDKIIQVLDPRFQNKLNDFHKEKSWQCIKTEN